MYNMNSSKLPTASTRLDLQTGIKHFIYLRLHKVLSGG